MTEETDGPNSSSTSSKAGTEDDEARGEEVKTSDISCSSASNGLGLALALLVAPCLALSANIACLTMQAGSV